MHIEQVYTNEKEKKRGAQPVWLAYSASFITATPLGNLKGRIEN